MTLITAIAITGISVFVGYRYGYLAGLRTGRHQERVRQRLAEVQPDAQEQAKVRCKRELEDAIMLASLRLRELEK